MHVATALAFLILPSVLCLLSTFETSLPFVVVLLCICVRLISLGRQRAARCRVWFSLAWVPSLITIAYFTSLFLLSGRLVTVRRSWLDVFLIQQRRQLIIDCDVFLIQAPAVVDVVLGLPLVLLTLSKVFVKFRVVWRPQRHMARILALGVVD